MRFDLIEDVTMIISPNPGLAKRIKPYLGGIDIDSVSQLTTRRFMDKVSPQEDYEALGLGIFLINSLVLANSVIIL